jgi:hypothetical protein
VKPHRFHPEADAEYAEAAGYTGERTNRGRNGFQGGRAQWRVLLEGITSASKIDGKLMNRVIMALYYPIKRHWHEGSQVAAN